MSFWELSDGDNAATTGKEYEMPTGNMEPIPDNSDVLAVIDEAKWATTNSGENYISLRWSVDAPEEFANRKVFQKLWVTDLDPNAKDETKAVAKRDKARKMLASIDANAGGRLTASNDDPTDESMTMALTNQPMVIKVMLWEMADRENYGEKIRGNWISAVKPKSAPLNVGKAAPVKASPKPSGYGAGGSALDDSIPFAPVVLI